MRKCLSFFHLIQLLHSKIIFASLIHDPPYFALFCIPNIKRTIGALGDTHWTIDSIAHIYNGINSGKSICKNFPFAGWNSIFKRNKSNKITRLRIRCTIGRAMKSYKGTFSITFWELIPLIKQQIVWSPMSWETQERFLKLIAPSDCISISSIFRSKDFFFLYLIVVTIGPPKVGVLSYFKKFFCRENRTLPGRKKICPQPQQIISSVHHNI